MDIKGFFWGPQYFPVRFRKAKRCRAVDRRANAVHGEYTNKTVRIDAKYNDWEGPGPVPVESEQAQTVRSSGRTDDRDTWRRIQGSTPTH